MNAKHLLHIKCNHQGTTFHAILDTGAQTNMMNYDLALKLDSNLDTSKKSIIKGVGTTTMIGNVTKTFSIGDVVCNGIEFSVTNNGDHFLCLLGSPFMVAFDTILHLKENYAIIQSQKIAILPYKEVAAYTGPYNAKQRELSSILGTIHSHDTKEFILKVINNIIAHPKEEKYKILNPESIQYKTNITNEFLLTSIGFVMCDDRMIFADSVQTLECAKSVLAY